MTIRVIVCDAISPEARRAEKDVPAGLRVSEIVGWVLPVLSGAERARVRVTVGFEAIDSAHWHFVRPHDGAIVTVRHVPGASSIAGFLTAQIINVTGITSLAASQIVYATALGATQIAVGAAVNALVNSLIPAPSLPGGNQSLPSPEEIFKLEGWSNRANPNGPVPYPVGRIRMAPIYATRPHSEVIDGEQYQSVTFLWGHGRLDISDVKFGESPVSDFTNVEIEHREGIAGDASHTLITAQHVEDSLSVELEPDTEGAPDSYTWASPVGTDRVRLIFHFPQGLSKIGDDGEPGRTETELRVEYSADGASWTTAADVTGSNRWVESTIDPFFREINFILPSPGTWQIKVTRLDQKPKTARRRKLMLLAFAQGIRDRDPLPYKAEAPLATTQVRVRANEMANGTLDALNGVVERYVEAWDGSAWVADQLSRNPAAIARNVLTNANANYRAATALKPGEWEDFYDHCEDKGLEFNRVLAGDEGLGEVLAGICAAGRGAWVKDGTGWGVIIDRPRDTPVDMITPRNATNLRWTRNYIDPPDAFRVTFRDETNGWQEAERIVPWPGLAGEPDPNRMEVLRIPGVTHPDQVWIEARRRQYEIIYRADEFTCEQSARLRVATRGDDVSVSWDTLDRAQAQARVTDVDGRYIHLDAPVSMEAGQSYAIRWIDWDGTDTVGAAQAVSVRTMAGEQRGLLLPDAETVPPVGREVIFGLAGKVSYLARITRVEPMQDGGARLTLKNEAPEVYDLTDAEVPPAWVPGAGVDTASGGTPDTPVIGTLTASAPEYDYSGTTDLEVSVPVSMPATNAVPIARIDVSHRVQGGGAYSVTSLDATSGAVTLSHARNAVIEVYATAVSVYGDASADTTVETFTVTGDAVTLPTALSAASMSAQDGLGAAQITVATQSDTAEVALFRVPSGDTLDPETHEVGAPRAVTPGSTVVLVDGDATRADIADIGDGAAWTEAGGVTLTGGVATHSTGTAGTLTRGLSLTAGQTYRGRIEVSGLTAGTITVRLTGGTAVDLIDVTANGAVLFSGDAGTGNDTLEIAWTSDCDGTVEALTFYDESSSSAPQGAWDYYAAPVSDGRVANTPSGPVTATIT